MSEDNAWAKGYVVGKEAGRAELEWLRAENERLRAALEKIASYGERHLGYLNCRIDDMSLSKFARTSLAQ